MNEITKKKDFKLLLTFFAVEFLLLLICFFIAHFQVNGNPVKAAGSDYQSFSASFDSVKQNLLSKTFNGNGVGGFTSILEGNENTGTPGNNSVLYKYYSFQLTDNGITSNMTKAAPGAQLDGILNNTATSTIIKEAKSTFTLGKFKIANDYVPEKLDLAKILEKPLIIEPMDKHGILIYHVHATEGYCKTEAEKADLNHYSVRGEENNVVEAGNTLQSAIASGSGIKTLHDKTVFQEGLESIVAYNNGAARLREIYAENQNIKLQIDLHRNSATLNNQKYGPTVEANGVKYAQFSFVVGLDWDPVTGDRSDALNPYWEDNMKLCLLIMEKLEAKVPGIVRQIDLRRNPYNQNFTENSILVEIGFDGNLTSEANASAKLLGDILCDIYG